VPSRPAARAASWRRWFGAEWTRGVWVRDGERGADAEGRQVGGLGRAGRAAGRGDRGGRRGAGGLLDDGVHQSRPVGSRAARLVLGGVPAARRVPRPPQGPRHLVVRRGRAGIGRRGLRRGARHHAVRAVRGDGGIARPPGHWRHCGVLAGAGVLRGCELPDGGVFLPGRPCRCLLHRMVRSRRRFRGRGRSRPRGG
jgi:hypothetical protein